MPRQYEHDDRGACQDPDERPERKYPHPPPFVHIVETAIVLEKRDDRRAHIRDAGRDERGRPGPERRRPPEDDGCVAEHRVSHEARCDRQPDQQPQPPAEGSPPRQHRKERVSPGRDRDVIDEGDPQRQAREERQRPPYRREAMRHGEGEDAGGREERRAHQRPRIARPLQGHEDAERERRQLRDPHEQQRRSVLRAPGRPRRELRGQLDADDLTAPFRRHAVRSSDFEVGFDAHPVEAA